MRSVDVLVVGAGPTGLMLAGWLVRHGLSVACIDAKSEIAPESRALAVHARTLETYDQLGIGGKALTLGRVGEGVSVWSQRDCLASLDLRGMGRGVSPHPYVYILSQDLNETLLFEHLQSHGGTVDWSRRLIGLLDGGDHVKARLEGPEGQEELTASYVCGCDGASSAVRHALGLRFPGGTYGEEFFVADVRASGDLKDGHINIGFNPGGFQLTFPMRGEGRARLVGVLPEQYRGQPDLDFEQVAAQATAPFGLQVSQTFWFSTYKVHHRVAPHFRLGRCFLLGDAAHVHSPVGGQGMNTGLMDATNLGWKLAAVLRRGADERLLDTYSAERKPFARRLVATTDRAFSLVTSRGFWAPLFRRLVPLVIRFASGFEGVRRVMFRLISQTSISYRGSWASRHLAPSALVRAGDRLPWVSSDGGPGNFLPLTSCDWQLHVYGETDATLSAWHRLPVHCFAFDKAAKRAGLTRNAVYLIRPDGYIGMVCQRFQSALVDDYLDEVGGTAAPIERLRESE